MNQKIGVIGTGQVGEALANGFLAHGGTVMRGSRDPGKLAEWKRGAGAKASTGTLADTAAFADVVVLAVKGAGAESAVDLCGAANLNGKTVIDTTNPIDDRPPESGVLHFFTDLNQALMERLQAAAPEAKFVKAFSCVGNAVMVDPAFELGRPTMFICGNDPRAKASVGELLDDFGWEVADLGGSAAARAIEPLSILWCIPGFLNQEWTHAFKLLHS